METGRVVLVGAGPGNPGLITINARYLLSIADVILYDYLAHPTLLSYAKTGSICICVGKKKGHHGQTQAEIHELMLKFFLEKKIVLRLKGGDPFVFGRGGEEVEFLIENQVPFDIVPGISAVTGVPALAGICLTHRTRSKSVAFFTGTLANGESTGAIPVADTLVCLMAVSKLTVLLPKLIKQYGPETPISIVSRGTYANQTLIKGTLKDISLPSIQYPALAIIGEMAAQGFYKNSPLFGRRFFIFRPFGEHLQEKAMALGAEVVAYPLLEIQELEFDLSPHTYDWVCFTSANGIRAFFKGITRLNQDIRFLYRAKFVVVGKKTAEALYEHGIKADIVSEKENSEDLLEKILKSPSFKKGASILLIQGTNSLPVLKEGLKNVHVLTVYESKMRLPPFTPCFQENDDLFLTSPLMVKALKNWADYLPNVTLWCIGLKTLKAATVYFPNQKKQLGKFEDHIKQPY